MRSHRRSLRRAATAVALAAAVVMPPAPASAHGRLPVGVYACYEYIGAVPQYSYFDFHIKADNRYVFKLGDERVGRGGRFAHPSTNRIRFRSGYLYRQGYKAEHQRSADDNTIVLTKEVNGGTAYYYCTD